MAPLLGSLIKGGGLVIEMHGMSPSKLRGCVQANYQQLIPNLQFMHCISSMIEVKKVLWQRFWLDSCTKQMVSARACANQFLPYSSSGSALFGMTTVQADSCLILSYQLFLDLITHAADATSMTERQMSRRMQLGLPMAPWFDATCCDYKRRIRW